MNGAKAKEFAFFCSCGAIQGRITAAGAKSATHAVCFCRDCRAAHLYFGQPDPASGPIEVLLMPPDDIRIDKGAEHLALMQLSPKGMLRCYAKCCNAPLATISPKPKLPFAAFFVDRIADTRGLAPITIRGFVPRPGGKQTHEKVWPAAIGLILRVSRSRLTGSWKNTPFFNPENGAPVSKPVVLTKTERAALYR